MLQSFNVNFSYKLRKGSPTTTRVYHVNAASAADAKLQIYHTYRCGCYSFCINSVTPHTPAQ